MYINHKLNYLKGRFHITKVEPAANGESAKVKVKVKINKNGILSVPSASMIEKVESKEEESMEAEPAKEGEATAEPSKPEVIAHIVKVILSFVF